MRELIGGWEKEGEREKEERTISVSSAVVCTSSLLIGWLHKTSVVIVTTSVTFLGICVLSSHFLNTTLITSITVTVTIAGT